MRLEAYRRLAAVRTVERGRGRAAPSGRTGSARCRRRPRPCSTWPGCGSSACGSGSTDLAVSVPRFGGARAARCPAVGPGGRAVARLTPVTLPASAEVRLRRLAPGATYQPEVHRLTVPLTPVRGHRRVRPGPGRAAPPSSFPPTWPTVREPVAPVRPPGSIAAVKRTSPVWSPPSSSLAVGRRGVRVRRSPRPPPRPTATTISVATLNTQLSALDGTAAGQCLLQLENPQLAATSRRGRRRARDLADQLRQRRAREPGRQPAGHRSTAPARASRSTRPTWPRRRPTRVDARRCDHPATSSSRARAGPPPPAQGPDRHRLTGQELLLRSAGQRPRRRGPQPGLRREAAGRGADLSNAAVLDYYVANQPQFTVDCVSQIITGSQAEADQVVSRARRRGVVRHAGQATRSTPRRRPTEASSAAASPRPRSNRTSSVTSITVGEPAHPRPDQRGPVGRLRGHQPDGRAADLRRPRSSGPSCSTAPPTSSGSTTSSSPSPTGPTISVNPQYGTWQRPDVVIPPAARRPGTCCRARRSSLRQRPTRDTADAAEPAAAPPGG